MFACCTLFVAPFIILRTDAFPFHPSPRPSVRIYFLHQTSTSFFFLRYFGWLLLFSYVFNWTRHFTKCYVSFKSSCFFLQILFLLEIVSFAVVVLVFIFPWFVVLLFFFVRSAKEKKSNRLNTFLFNTFTVYFCSIHIFFADFVACLFISFSISNALIQIECENSRLINQFFWPTNKHNTNGMKIIQSHDCWASVNDLLTAQSKSLSFDCASNSLFVAYEIGQTVFAFDAPLNAKNNYFSVVDMGSLLDAVCNKYQKKRNTVEPTEWLYWDLCFIRSAKKRIEVNLNRIVTTTAFNEQDWIASASHNIYTER